MTEFPLTEEGSKPWFNRKGVVWFCCRKFSHFVKMEDKDYADYLNHIDDKCKNRCSSFIAPIQIMLLNKHNNNPYYQIPFEVSCICSAYYCKHLNYRLSFKKYFIKNGYPTYQRNQIDKTPLCSQYKTCPSIQRIIFLLSLFQKYMNTSCKEYIIPYMTYRYYPRRQIKADMIHIDKYHHKNMIKYYIRDAVFKSVIPSSRCPDDCHHSNTMQNFLKQKCNDKRERRLRFCIWDLHDVFIHDSLHWPRLKYALGNIVESYTGIDRQNLFLALTRATEKLWTKDMRVRIDRRGVFGDNVVTEYLSLIGYEWNEVGDELICEYRPPDEIIESAIYAVDFYCRSSPTNDQIGDPNLPDFWKTSWFYKSTQLISFK